MENSRNSILSGIFFGLFSGVFYAFLYGNICMALITGIISGVLFGFGLYLFITSKKVKQQTRIQTTADDVLIYSGSANHFVKGEAVGGKLYLLVDKLQFQSHHFAIQSHGLIIEITQIAEVAFYNTLGLVPNGLAIKTTEGKIEKFVVNNRKVWKTEIEKLITNG